MNLYEILTVESFGEIAEQDSSHRDHSARAMLIGNDSRIVADVYTVADAEKIAACVKALRPFTLADGTTIPIDTKEARCRLIISMLAEQLYEAGLSEDNLSSGKAEGWIYKSPDGKNDIGYGKNYSYFECYCRAVVEAGLIAKEEIE